MNEFVAGRLVPVGVGPQQGDSFRCGRGQRVLDLALHMDALRRIAAPEHRLPHILERDVVPVAAVAASRRRCISVLFAAPPIVGNTRSSMNRHNAIL